MKTYSLPLALLMMLFVTLGNAQKYFPSYESYQKANLDRAAKHYLISLESTNEGIVMSALAHIGRISLYFPDKHFPDLEKKVAELSMTGQTSKIRYRAFLISNLVTSPAIFANESRMQFDDSEALFSALANTLDSTLLGSINAQ